MANLTLKVIKASTFKYKETDHTSYTCAYKGRVFGVSTMQWGEDIANLVFDDKAQTLKLTCDVEVVKQENIDPLTAEKTRFLNIVPKIDICLSEF